MALFNCRTKNGSSPREKSRVYFTCHPDDFSLYFDKLCGDIWETRDCAIYYTEDMREPIAEEDRETDLGRMNLFIVPITRKLLSEPCRAMVEDIAFAKQANIPILPFMMESGLDADYSESDKFGERQYLSPFSVDMTAIGYGEKLKKYLENLLITDEMTRAVRAAFDSYIFLSYRKKDRKYARQLMRIIHESRRLQSVAVWFDEFLTPGESYRENILKAMSQSSLFLLLVTPSILEYTDGKPNFVMATEYPAAKREGMRILAAKMKQTDEKELLEKFPELPPCLDPLDEESFRALLESALCDLPLKEGEYDPEKEFLVGMGYLLGIDLEIDRVRGLEMIESAAAGGWLEAMLMLYKIYSFGIEHPIDHREAAKWGERAVGRCIELYGELNPNTFGMISGLAETYEKLGDIKRAMETREWSCALHSKLLGTKHMQTLMEMYRLALLYKKLGDYEGAKKYGGFVYTEMRDKLGEAHDETLAVLEFLTMIYGKLGNSQIELELTERLYRGSFALYGEENGKTILALNNLAIGYAELGNFEKALELGKKLYELNFNMLGAYHEDTVAALDFLVNMYDSLEDYKMAALCYEKLYMAYCEICGQYGEITLETLRSLSITYFQMGEYVRACEGLKKAYLMFKGKYGAEHPATVKTYNILQTAEDMIRRAIEAQDKN